jgi:hypothetical protein
VGIGQCLDDLAFGHAGERVVDVHVSFGVSTFRRSAGH